MGGVGLWRREKSDCRGVGKGRLMDRMMMSKLFDSFE